MVEAQDSGLACACVIGFAFSANYTSHAPLAGMQVPGGHLVDRLDARTVLIFALAWVALGNRDEPSSAI